MIIRRNKIVHVRVNNSASNRALIPIPVSFPLPISTMWRDYIRDCIEMANASNVLSPLQRAVIFSELGLPLLFSPTETARPINCHPAIPALLDKKNGWVSFSSVFASALLTRANLRRRVTAKRKTNNDGARNCDEYFNATLA